MPRYAYRCSSCGEEFLIIHPSNEILEECERCEVKGKLEKLLTVPLYSSSKKTTSQKVGQITEDFIKESRNELHQQKEDMNKER